MRRRVTAPDPDTEAMLRVKSGAADAFRLLVTRFARPLASFFVRLGADRSLAEDCAQEVFLKLYRTRAAYEPRARFSTYLFSIARHHWIDVVRHRAAGPRMVSADDGGPDGDGDRSPAAGFEAREEDPGDHARRTEIERAVAEGVALLPPEQREVFALARSEHLRYQEIAEILQIPVGTVKSRVHAAVQAFRDHLRRRGIEP
jgi:RNA polymerase sigma-70 factor (ECF subfamily)